MIKKMLLAPTVALLAFAAPAAATTVRVRVEGKTKTLLASKTVAVHGGYVTKYGAPSGECPRSSAQGALDTATRGRWRGSWSTEYGPEYFITQILGETESGSKQGDYWELFVNHVVAATGACQISLHKSDQLLFAAVPTSGAYEYPLGIRAVEHSFANRSVTITVVRYDARGKAHALPGATVTVGASTLTTDARGQATVRPTKAGRYTIRARKSGYIRDEATLQVRL